MRKNLQLIWMIGLLMIVNAVHSQHTMVNTKWTSITGYIGQYDWSSTCLDPQKRLCTTGNKVMNGQGTNISTIRYNEDGTIAWEANWNGLTNGDDYGTAITADASSIYVCGATFNVINNDFDFVVLKYDLINGTLLWSYIYSDPAGGMDIPADIALDVQSKIFVTGVRQGSATLADYCTLSISSGGTLLWSQFYDYANSYELAAKIVVKSNGDCVVTGGSGNSWTDGDFCSVWYSSNGVQQGVKRTGSLTTFFDQPLDMKKDASDNIYVVGRIGTSGSGEDMKLIKLDQELNILWSVTKDGYALNDLAQSLAVDDSGSIYVSGYFTNSNNLKEACIVKYNSAGVFQWQRTIKSAFGGNAIAYKVKVLGNLVYVVGDIMNEASNDIFVFVYDELGNQIWTKPIDGGSNSNDGGRGLEISEPGKIYITGKTTNSQGDKYFAGRYEELKRSMEPVYSGNHPLYVKNEIILWFDPALVNLDIVNDNKVLFGKLTEFVSLNAIEQLNGALGRDLKDQTTIKVFEHWNSSFTNSLARDGSIVSLPPFWSAFVLTLPDGMDASWAAQQISGSLWSIIKTVDLNWLYQLYDDSNDTEYPNQQSLFENDPNVVNDINIEPAWDITKGNINIKVGVFDTGVEWSHEDFGDGSFSGSSIIGGWDWINGQPISNLQSDVNGHGTAVSGVIGARRNNNLGIAGIAGGDWSDANNPQQGVQLFSFKVISDDNTEMISTDYVVDAMIEGAVCVSDGNGGCSFGYGLHVMNNSWGLQGYYTMTTQQINDYFHHQDLMGEAVHQVAANGCINVIAAGNSDTDFGSSPANTSCPENYAIQVGASNLNGKKLYNSNWGDKIDFLAPGDPNLTRTTSNADNEYVAFSATSCASPHVAGTAALLVSHVTGNPDAPNILHPEDVERLLERYAHDVYFTDDPDYPVGPDSKSQNGLIDAGNTVLHTQLPYYKVRHFSANLGSGDVAATSENSFIHVEGSPTVPTGNYLADVFLMQKTINFEVGNETILDVWTRDAHSSPVGCFNFLPRYPDIDLISWNQNSAVVQGCVYHFTLQIVGSQIFPVDIWYPHQNNTGTMAISVHTYDSTIGVDELEEIGTLIKGYPNPSTADFQISLETLSSGNVHFEVYDALGEVIYIDQLRNVHQGMVTWTIPSSSWSPGLYNCRVIFNDKNYQLKLIKQ
ncbi:MAG: hypothetical protein RL092_343 [Bacteroidota bacterium]|jgi:subtilisin family serine protease